jgi:hypothetical protein
MITTVAQDEGVQAVQARLNALEAEVARLRTRHHALTFVAAHYLGQRVVMPPEVGGMTPADAQREMAEIDRQLHALARRIDAEQGALKVADSAAQASIVEAELPAYRRLVDACERAQAALGEAEAKRLAFLAELRERGVFEPPLIAEKA